MDLTKNKANNRSINYDKKFMLILILLMSSLQMAYSQQELTTDSLFNLSIENLMNLEVEK